jgi:3-hydroxyacyl-CoA dehydrogenase / enoyl-CoA hydratase / 3-hydroxybutyryl-CoA epimerase
MTPNRSSVHKAVAELLQSPSSYRSKAAALVVLEGMALLGEGTSAEQVERHGGSIALADGPLALADEAELALLDEILHSELDVQEATDRRKHRAGHDHQHNHGTAPYQDHEHSHKRQPGWIPPSAVYVLEKMAHGYKRLGREHGAGFYDYPANEPKRLWSGLKVFERGGKAIPGEDVRDRLLYAAAIEGLRRLDDPATLRAEAVALAEVLGPGFPACDPVAFVQSVGLREFAERAQQLAARYGDRFVVPTGALERVAGGRSS